MIATPSANQDSNDSIDVRMRRVLPRFLASKPFIYVLAGALFLCAMLVRASLFPFVSGDYTSFLSPWYDFIKNNGGFAALKSNFSNYNPPYLYLLAAVTYLPFSKIVAIKSISVVFDVLLALFAYLIVRLKSGGPYLPLAAAIVMLFLPTVVINSSARGQCDAIYAAFCLGSLYFLLKQRWGWVCVFFGLAISFKLQAIFLLPVLLMFVLKRTIPLRYLLLIPAIFLALLAPAYLLGRDAGSLISIYGEQVNTGGLVRGANQTLFGQGLPPTQPQGRRFGNRPARPSNNGSQLPRRANGFGAGAGRGFGGIGRFGSLQFSAPTIYQWLKDTFLANNRWVGIGLAALVVALVGILLLVSKVRLTFDIILNISLVCVVALPFLLPEMHERYFYLADVVTLLFAFAFPRWFFLPIIMQAASLVSYAPFLLRTDLVNLSYVSFAVLLITLVACARLVFRSWSQGTQAVAMASAT